MTSFDSAVRILRFVHLAILLSIPLYALLGEFAGPSPGAAGDFGFLHKVLLAVTVASFGIFTLMRITMVRPAEDALSRNPDDATAIGRWTTGSIVTYALSESVAIFGLVVRLLGGNFAQAVPFYAAAFLLLIFVVPRRP
jgi:F0F1-type ATP synthase membrane subunit c/vacuolar-type H+-ATPase subunit K